MPFNETRKGALTWGSAEGPEGQYLRVVSRRVDLTPAQRSDGDYTFIVAGDMAEVERQISEFNTTLFWSFLLLGVGLIVAILLQVRIGLQPLRRVSEALARIRDGKARRLDGQFPTEIAPLATELNSLIQHSEEVVGRARTHVSNLAHFLKTPLSVLAAEADAVSPVRCRTWSSVRSFRCAVRSIIISPERALPVRWMCWATAPRYSAVMDDLARVIGRIHAPRSIVIDAECSDAIYFRRRAPGSGRDAGQSDRQCLQMGEARVRSAAITAGGRLILTVEDDGPGLSAEQRDPGRRTGRKAGRKRAGLRSGPGHRAGYFQALRGLFSVWTPARWAVYWPAWNCPAIA